MEMPPMPSECQRGVPITSLPGIPGYQAYNFVPQYGNQFGQFLQTPQQQNFAQSYGSQFGQFFDTPQLLFPHLPEICKVKLKLL